MTIRRRHLLAAALAAPAMRATAQPAWPARPVRLVVPNAPGGGSDILTRTMQGELQKVWGQSVLVEYKPGAGTVLGTDYVAKSAPDGYTLGVVVTSHVINPALRRNLPYDTLKDLAHVTLTAQSALVLAAAPKFAGATLKEVIEYGRAHPGKLSYATPGAGSSMHLAAELLRQQAGFDMLHVPYKGTGGGAYTDVADGRVDLLVDALFAAMPHVRNGRLKPIAVLSAKRDGSAPQIPAAGELLPGFDVRSINGIVAPAGTPRELVQRISADFARALKADSLRARLHEMGLEPVASSPQEFEATVRAEIRRWDAVVKKGQITLD